jgi:ligand-binding SRPBCC domain-containing protein
MAFYQLNLKQFIPAPVESLWDFLSNPQNLKKITPGYMGFNITSENIPEKIYPGMIICYKIKPLAGIKMTWVTEITHVQENKYFVDEQRIGPYSIWHHQHIIEPVENGVLMRDIVSYKPPLGILGEIANALFIRQQLKEIFEYRTKAIAKRFGKEGS